VATLCSRCEREARGDHRGSDRSLLVAFFDEEVDVASSDAARLGGLVRAVLEGHVSMPHSRSCEC